MKVAFVAYEYPPYSFGGIGSFSRDLSLGLSSAGVKITVIGLSHLRTITKEIINPNLTVIRVPTLNFPPRHLWWQTGNHNVIVKLLTKLSPDLIHSNGLVATLPLRTFKGVSGVPQIVTIHGYNQKILEILLANNRKLFQPRDFFAYVLFEPLYDMLLQIDVKTADCVVAVAQHLKNDLQRRFKMANMTTVHNGIEVEPGLSDEYDADVGGKEQAVGLSRKRTTRIAYAGRLYWLKGITHAMNAFAALMRLHHPDNVEFNIYGDGPLQGEVRKFAASDESAGLVRYHGSLPREQLIAELRNNDIVLIPSLYEACPVVLLEALALGKAVVVNSMPWSEEFIEDRVNGLRVDTRDPVAFANGLFELIDNWELREQISQNAKKDVEKYSISNVTRMYASIYQGLAQ